MKPVWYVPPVSDDAKRICVEVRLQGLKLLDDAKGDPWPYPKQHGERAILSYGSIEQIKHNQQSTDAGCFKDWCDWHSLSCSYYYPKWGPYLLNQNYGFYPYGDLIERPKLAETFANQITGDVFVRPDTNDKSFPGGVVSVRGLKLWLLKTPQKPLPIDAMCLLARPSNILEEYRIVICDSQIVTSSTYVRHDRLISETGASETAHNFAIQASKVWSPHRIFVLDVARTTEGNHGIIECGSIHTCGLYGCSAEAIVSTMTRICQEELAASV